MILMYHKVDLTSPTMWWVTVNSFYQQMMDLRAYQVVYLSEYDSKNPRHVVISFDGIYQNILKYAAPILKKFGYPFELFLTSDYLGKGNEFDSVEPHCMFTSISELKQLTSFGGRLQWHTRSHPNMEELNDKKQIKAELDIPESIRTLDPSGFEWFAYPYGKFNQQVLDEVKKTFRGAVSCIQGAEHDPYLFNRVTVEDHWRIRKHSISVVIPSYNYGNFLVEAVESVLKQTRPCDQILIADDASVDETAEIARMYVSRYPGLIETYSNKENLGIINHFNKAVSLCRGEYLCFLGADNRFCANYLENTSALLDGDDQIAIAYTDYAFFGPRAKLEYEASLESFRGEVLENKFFLIHFPSFDQEAQSTIGQRNFIHGSSMYRKSAFQHVGGYLSEKQRPEDHSLFLRMINAGMGAKKALNTYLEYRQHSIEQANQRFQSLATIQFLREELKRNSNTAAIADSSSLLHNGLEALVSKQKEIRALRNEANLIRQQLDAHKRGLTLDSVNSTVDTSTPVEHTVSSELSDELNSFLKVSSESKDFLASCLVCDQHLFLNGVGSVDTLGKTLVHQPLLKGQSRYLHWPCRAHAILELYFLCSRRFLRSPRVLQFICVAKLNEKYQLLLKRQIEFYPGEDLSIVSLDILPQSLSGASDIILKITSLDGDIDNAVSLLHH